MNRGTLIAGCAAMSILIGGCGGGGGGVTGTGAAFAKAFGGDEEASARTLLPMSDGYLMLGNVGDELSLSLLDGNGDQLAPVTRNGTHADFGMGGVDADSTTQVAISPAQGGWIRTEFDYSAADNSYRLVVSHYLAGATPGSAPTRPWRNPQTVSFNTTPWHGGAAQLTDGTQLLAVKTQSATGSWHGVLALVRESAYVGYPVSGGTQEELHSRYTLWRFNFNGTLQSVTELDEWLGGTRFGSINPLKADWALGADGAYLVRIYSDNPLDTDERYWRNGADGSPSPAIPAGLTVSAASPLGSDLLWVEGNQLKRMDSSGGTQVVADLSADVHSGETLVAGSHIVCTSTSACRVTAQTSDQLQLLWDQDGNLLSQMSLATDLPTPDYTLSGAAVAADGSLLLMLQRPYDRYALSRIAADLSARTTTDLTTYMSGFSTHELSDSGLIVHRDGYSRPEFLPVLNVYDDNLATVYDLTAATAAADERGVAVRRAVGLANDRSLALMADGSVLRLNRDYAVEQIPSPRLANGDLPFSEEIDNLVDGQGYLLQHGLLGWSVHDLDGTLRWSAELRNVNGETVLPLHSLPLPNGDTLLIAVNSYGNGELILYRVDSNGSRRWIRVYDTHLTNVIALRSTELADGSLLLAILEGTQGITLIKVDGLEGRLVMSRDLLPASGGYTPSLLPGFELVTAADGSAWLGFTSYRLVWRETAATANGGRVPIPYGEKNLALVRLDDQLQPDRLRVYGAAGNETLLDLRAAPEGGLLVAAETDSIGLGTARHDAWVMRLDADGMIGSGCQALLMHLEDTLASQFLGATGPLTLNNLPSVEDGVSLTTIDFQTAQNPALTSSLFNPVDLQAARMCLAGLGEMPPPEPPPSGDYTLTVTLDGGPGLSGVTTGETPPQFECYLDYAATNTCTATYTAGSTVALYADTASGAVLDLEGCTPGLDNLERPICSVTMDANHTVLGHRRLTHLLSLTIDGQPSQGTTVFSSGSNAIYCVSPDTSGTTCFADIREGDEVLLSWNNIGGYALSTWSGCTPEPNATNTATNCRLTMDTDHAVTATFGPRAAREATK